MPEQLKACPFCGSIPTIKEDRIGWLVCDLGLQCDGSGLWIAFDLDRKSEAIATWNTRADQAVEVKPSVVSRLLDLAELLENMDPDSTSQDDADALRRILSAIQTRAAPDIAAPEITGPAQEPDPLVSDFAKVLEEHRESIPVAIMNHIDKLQRQIDFSRGGKYGPPQHQKTIGLITQGYSKTIAYLLNAITR